MKRWYRWYADILDENNQVIYATRLVETHAEARRLAIVQIGKSGEYGTGRLSFICRVM